MLKLNYLFMLLASVLVVFSCNDSSKEITAASHNDYLANLQKDTGVRYARRFSIGKNKYCTVVYLFGSLNIKDTSAMYVILNDSTLQFNESKKTTVLKTSCKRIASLSSVYTTMLCGLNEINHIIAVENIDYYNNKQVLEKFNRGKLAELSKGPKLDIEKTIALHPDIIFAFGMGNPEKDVNEKIIQAKIPLVVTADHLEETPLARAEWIKFFAAFVNKSGMADSIFKKVEGNYFHLKKIASAALTKPTVFSEIKFGEIWYVPGGKSFAATFFNDANGDYIWKDNKQTGSLHLSFEEVYNKAKGADLWLNMALVTSKKELFGFENRYSEFKAYKTGSLYNNIKTTNSKGYSDYWETGILYPDRVLNDLILIFHPELKAQLKNDLYYYKKLN